MSDSTSHPTLHTRRIHAYAASFGDDLARDLILANTREGDMCLDPFSGAATTLIQARLLGRPVIGIDVDPVAALIGKVSTTAYTDDEVRHLYHSVSQKIRQITPIMSEIILNHPEFEPGCRISMNGLSASIPQNDKLQFWFAPIQRLVLAMLVAVSRSYGNPNHRNIIDVAISSAIIHKWPATISQARDIDHSRPHRVLRSDLTLTSQIGIFDSALKCVVRNLNRINSLVKGDHVCEALEGDATEVVSQIEPNTVDYVLTSPPYFNAIDYPRAHKFSQWWLWPDRGQLNALSYIGLRSIERDAKNDFVGLCAALIPSQMDAIAPLRAISKSSYSALCRYVVDVDAVVKAIARVLKDGKCLSFILANNRIKGTETPVVSIVCELLQNEGFQSVTAEKRNIRRDRRRYPFGLRGFRGPMDSEYVINARKR